MGGRVVKKEFIFMYQTGLVQVNEREEKIFAELIKKYGAMINVPAEEIISVYSIKKVKDKFIADVNYFYVPINELQPAQADEEMSGKGKKVLLNIFNLLKIKN
jgi:hypothetical protein